MKILNFIPPPFWFYKSYLIYFGLGRNQEHPDQLPTRQTISQTPHHFNSPRKTCAKNPPPGVPEQLPRRRQISLPSRRRRRRQCSGGGRGVGAVPSVFPVHHYRRRRRRCHWRVRNAIGGDWTVPRWRHARNRGGVERRWCRVRCSIWSWNGGFWVGILLLRYCDGVITC